VKSGHEEQIRNRGTPVGVKEQSRGETGRCALRATTQRTAAPTFFSAHKEASVVQNQRSRPAKSGRGSYQKGAHFHVEGHWGFLQGIFDAEYYEEALPLPPEHVVQQEFTNVDDLIAAFGDSSDECGPKEAVHEAVVGHHTRPPRQSSAATSHSWKA